MLPAASSDSAEASFTQRTRAPGLAATPLRVVTNRSVPFRPRIATAWIAVALALATALIALLSGLRFAYDSVDAHVMIATAVALIGMLVAGLVAARFLRSHQLQDLALTLALIVLSLSNLFMSAIPSAFGDLDSHFVAWGPFAGRLLGAFLFALSVAIPDREVPHPRRAVWLTFAGGLALTGGLMAVVAVAAPSWGDPMSDAILPAASDSPHLSSDTLQLVVLALVFALYVLATVGFVRRAEETRDELIG